MIVQHQFFLLIYILCYAAAIHGILSYANDAETCNLLCIQCNASAVFTNGHCECNFADDSEKVSGAECIQRIERDIQAIELNMLSEDLTEEERNVRSILKYRRRLRSESAPYASPTVQGEEMYPQTRLQNPAIIYPARGMYDPTLSSIAHPRGLPHALFRAVTFPAHVLHHILHPRVYHHPMHHHPVYHRGIVRSTNDGSETSITDQSRENNGGFTSSNFPTAGSNLYKPVEQNTNGLTDPSQYPEAYITHALYQPVQYRTFPQPYTSYYSPLINVLYPNRYIFQPVSPHAQDISDLLTSDDESNPCFCKKNANTEQRNGILTADKPIPFNDETSDNPTRNNIPKEENRAK